MLFRSAQIRDAAWQEIIMRDLFLRNAEKAGISVGDDEMKEAAEQEEKGPDEDPPDNTEDVTEDEGEDDE